ncbi:MAG: EAL domain-containing protein [Acidobacteriota bacterium]
MDANTPHILIVDDEPSIRKLLSSILGEVYSCTLAESAEAALSHLQNERFDVVISDINMGGMDGIELTSRVLAASPETVVMMISGNQSVDSPIDAMRTGAFDYIKKPFDIDQVEMAVARAVAHASLLVSKRQHETRLEELVAERTTKLDYLAYNDPLTGLRNRIYFEDELARILGTPANNRKTGVILVSLDRFKLLRDTLGHAAGDRLLVQAAKRLRGVLTKGALAARFERDEFAILLSPENRDEFEELGESISAAFRKPLEVDGHAIVATASIGLSLSPDDGDDPSALLKNSAAALAHARKNGGDQHKFFTRELRDAAIRRHSLENELRGALERQEFQLHYQPKIDVRQNKIVGMEALIRWFHPGLGLVPPLDFIPLAEETGLIMAIGEWVIETACAQSKVWHDEGHILELAVNLSPRQFQQKDLAGRIIEIVNNTGFDPHFLNLEVTESSITNDCRSAIELLTMLRVSGIKISIDDFGTGYSSLGLLKDLPIDVLKIDKTFLDDVTINTDDESLVTAVITLAHNLKLKVVAEGVETEGQLELLRRLDCDEWQGYLCNKPLSVPAFQSLLTNVSESTPS